MSEQESKLIKAAREAVRFAAFLQQFDLENEAGHTTVFVGKKGKILGTVYGARPPAHGERRQ
jgi:hypothetical protein